MYQTVYTSPSDWYENLFRSEGIGMELEWNSEWAAILNTSGIDLCMHEHNCLDINERQWASAGYRHTPLPSAVHITSVNEGQLVTHTHRGELCSALKWLKSDFSPKALEYNGIWLRITVNMVSSRFISHTTYLELSFVQGPKETAPRAAFGPPAASWISVE